MIADEPASDESGSETDESGTSDETALVAEEVATDWCSSLEERPAWTDPLSVDSPGEDSIGDESVGGAPA